MTGVQTCALPILNAGGYITRVNLANTNGYFKADDYVFQGNTFQTATATGMIVSYNSNTSQMIIGAVQGRFQANTLIHALSTSANTVLSSFYNRPMKFVEIEIVPSPITATPLNDYGYNINITEWPDTELPTSNVLTFSTDTLDITTDEIDISTDAE